MASSDDEFEPVPQAVTTYYFVDEADELISFSKLPVQWNKSEKLDCGKKQIFLHGIADGGLQKVYKQVTAWKFKLSGANPEISVLSKEKNWIKLEKPRKSFKDIIRTTLITVHCLHILRKNPETSKSTLWSRLSKDFSLYQIRPSEDDLVGHKTLINEAAKRDKLLAKSKFLGTFLEEQPRKRKAFDEETGSTAESGSQNDGDMIDETEEYESDEEGELFDSVCAICDNGGELLCCEGRCLRSFHATAEAGSDSMCESLGLSNKQVEAIQNFICKNCESKEHQCFSCGKLGSSDKSLGAEVFACVSATCGRFYHPHCVSKLVHHNNVTEVQELQRKIAAGEPFTCPAHKCYRCKEGENKMNPELQFAVCRRCPKSYHRKCLPRKIAFEDLEDEGIIQRAWEDLLPNRILIYCLDHEIDDDIGTPTRNHIKFPNIGHKKRKQESDDLLLRREKPASKERHLVSEESSRKKKVNEKLSSAIKVGDSSKKRGQTSVGPEASKKQKVVDTSPNPLNNTFSTKMNGSTTNEDDDCWDERLNTYLKKRKDDNDIKHPMPLDDDSKKKISDLMRDVVSSITLEEIVKKHKMPSTHPYSSRNIVDKGITLGKVERSIEALHAALKKLEEERSSLEDAIAVCEPELVDQIFKWQSKFEVYLAPFLHGMTYTSFGRHFTRVEKLKEIVDIVHWYVQDGDMVVDFSCGANDFSCLMKKMLDETGKKCKYKNYDIIQAKNDFNFEARDWMSVRPKELQRGSQLVMGLTPPRGINSALVNKFIDKAIEFKPKLLILIVPQETERLDKKKKGPGYDLIWEDAELLSGKPFYLPGSTVDISDKQIDEWNLNPPPLYLWSRADWTARHKIIAEQHGHLSRLRSDLHLIENISDFPMEDHIENPTMIDDDNPVQNEEPERPQTLVIETSKEGSQTKKCHKKNHQPYERKSSEGKPSKVSSGIGLGSDGYDDRSHSNDIDDKYVIDLKHEGMIQDDPLAFAPGLCLPFAKENSAGWLDE